MRMKEVSWAEKLGAAAAAACTALPACGAESALPSAPVCQFPLVTHPNPPHRLLHPRPLTA